jgi:hypothetical protein
MARTLTMWLVQLGNAGAARNAAAACAQRRAADARTEAFLRRFANRYDAASAARPVASTSSSSALAS